MTIVSMECACADRTARDGPLICFLIAEDHLWITTAWHFCSRCHRVWSEDEDNGWAEVAFAKLRDPNIWVAGLNGIYPEHELVDVETFARWVKKLDAPYHTCPMV